jgi:hypothetical protein
MRSKLAVVLSSSLLLLLRVATAPAADTADTDAPFGIGAGADPAALGCKLTDPARKLWRCPRPPSPQAGFTDYAVLAATSAGVCHVLASTEAIAHDRAGAATRSRVDAVATRLTVEYGDWRVHADTRADAARAAVDAGWLAAVQHEQQTYSYTWLSPARDVVMIVLKAAALDAETGRVTVEYFLANPACAREHDSTPDVAT